MAQIPKNHQNSVSVRPCVLNLQEAGWWDGVVWIHLAQGMHHLWVS